jgi:hypothetical protein
MERKGVDRKGIEEEEGREQTGKMSKPLDCSEGFPCRHRTLLWSL